MAFAVARNVRNRVAALFGLGRGDRPPGVRSETIVLDVNGQLHEVEAEPLTTLLSVLRDQLGLTGTKLACGRGECGSCTVLLDGYSIMSCVQLAHRTKGQVTTVESITRAGPRIPESFADKGGYQCGYCTSGHIVRGAELLETGLPADDVQLRKSISGNICRCTGYQQIVESLRQAAQETIA